jgi:neutral ceramidase
VVGYTDGALWYVPTPEAYAEGGYEVDDACRVAPEAGLLLQRRTLALLRGL